MKFLLSIILILCINCSPEPKLYTISNPPKPSCQCTCPKEETNTKEESRGILGTIFDIVFYDEKQERDERKDKKIIYIQIAAAIHKN